MLIVLLVEICNVTSSLKRRFREEIKSLCCCTCQLLHKRE